MEMGREVKTERLTFTTLSHPQETMTGMTGLGEKRTQETLWAKVSTVGGCGSDERGQGVVSNKMADIPLGVPVIHNVEFALSKRVPQLDRPVPRSRHNLTVVGRKGDPNRV